MQIDKIRFKAYTEQEKQCQHINNFCLYCEKPCHVAHKCPKKHGPHVTRTIFVTNPQLEESKNEDV
jgi:5-methylcytosine-specific restriction endonuclease McrA